jgi:hypothetical protein
LRGVGMEEKTVPPLVFVGIGLLGIAIGTAIILTQTSVLPIQQKLGPGVTSWIVVCAGIVFAGIGGVFALTGFSGTGIGSRIQQRAPILFRVLNFLVAVAALCALATIASFAAFGPGPRQFSFTVPFFGQVPGTEWIGRIFFGAAALLLWGVIAVFVWFGLKGEQSKKQDNHPL